MKMISLNGFLDAGQNARGIAIYIRFFNAILKMYESLLIYSATRIPSTKSKLSIPRKKSNVGQKFFQKNVIS